MGGPRSLRRVGSLRAFVLSSSKVPSWVVARLLVVESIQVAFRRRLKTPRPIRAAPRKRGACAAVRTAALPKECPTMHHRPRHRAHIAAHTRPMTLDPLPISRSAPPRGHTPRNLTLFAHQPPTAAASGAEAVPLGSGDASSHLPALPCAGRGRGVTNPLRRGTAAAGRGFLPSYRCLLQVRPYHIANRMRSAYKGCRAHPASTTHAQEAARVVDGET